MLRWTGTAHTRVPSTTAFAYLADPRHAPQWFGRVAVADLAPGLPRVGQHWRFVESRRRGAPSAKPVRIVAYDAPRQFTWETELPRWRTNLVWTVVCAPDPARSTTLTLVLRWRPGVLDWPVTLTAGLVGHRALAARTQGTVDQARDAVEAAYPAPSASTASTRPNEGARGRSGKRHKRR
jgi:hypothetical protein